MSVVVAVMPLPVVASPVELFRDQTVVIKVVLGNDNAVVESSGCSVCVEIVLDSRVDTSSLSVASTGKVGPHTRSESESFSASCAQLSRSPHTRSESASFSASNAQLSTSPQTKSESMSFSAS